MLSILTGTTVQVTGGGGGGTHSWFGQLQWRFQPRGGGVDFEIENVTEDGTFFGVGIRSR